MTLFYQIMLLRCNFWVGQAMIYFVFDSDKTNQELVWIDKGHFKWELWDQNLSNQGGMFHRYSVQKKVTVFPHGDEQSQLSVIVVSQLK